MKDDHDPEKCFNCRLQALREEFFPEPLETKRKRCRILAPIAVMVAMALRHCDDPEELTDFAELVAGIRNLLVAGDADEQTLH